MSRAAAAEHARQTDGQTMAILFHNTFNKAVNTICPLRVVARVDQVSPHSNLVLTTPQVEAYWQIEGSKIVAVDQTEHTTRSKLTAHKLCALTTIDAAMLNDHAAIIEEPLAHGLAESFGTALEHVLIRGNTNIDITGLLDAGAQKVEGRVDFDGVHSLHFSLAAKHRSRACGS